MKRWRAVGGVILALLRELADENAYRRHLAMYDRIHSAEEWRRFADARWKAKYSQTKCC
jgi:hypothetical protein